MSTQSCSPAEGRDKKQEIFDICNVRPTLLDIWDPKSDLNKSNFSGLFIMLHTCIGIWILTNSVSSILNDSTIFSADNFKHLFEKLPTLISTWFGLYTSCYLAYILIKLKMYVPIVFQDLLIQTLIFIWQLTIVYSVACLIKLNSWDIYSTTFILIVMMIYLMKIHAFIYSCLSYAKKTSPYFDVYKQEVSFRNFNYFLFYPTLVFKLQYPRSLNKFRTKYFIAKFITMLCTIYCIAVLSTTKIGVIIKNAPRKPVLNTLCQLIIPLLIMELLIFYLIFEGIMNLIAEITKYGDRTFYLDWWNCTTWEEFNRKWNYSVHSFLKEYIYLGICKRGTKSRKKLASLITFLYSAVLHELFLTLVLGFLSYWISTLMMIQIPLMMFSKFHKNTVIGNWYVWGGLIIGVPMLVLLYGTEWAFRRYFTFL